MEIPERSIAIAGCRHGLTSCNDCEGNGCGYCNGRGYYEVCWHCKQPMGSLRKKWKRDGWPMPWQSWAYNLRHTPKPKPRRPQCKDLPTLEMLFAMWAWHEEVKNVNRGIPKGTGIISLEMVRKYPPSVDKVMMHLYGVPEKLVYAKLNKLVDQDLIEYGGSVRLGWPTEKGLKMLREAGLIGGHGNRDE